MPVWWLRMVTAPSAQVLRNCAPFSLYGSVSPPGPRGGPWLDTTTREQWPASPEITVADIQRYEKQAGELKPGDIVLFQSGWTDKHYKPLPAGTACMENPLNGKSEGWPAPGPDTIAYLADKGVRCVGTDAPTLGGVDPKRALMTYWLLGSKRQVGVEFLTNLGQLPEGGYFVFAAMKIRDCHGGPGRALAFY